MNGEQYVKELTRLEGVARDLLNSISRLKVEASGDPNPLPLAEDGPPSGFDAYHEERPPDPNTAETATPAQLALMGRLAAERNLDLNTECRRVHNCPPNELPKRMASAFIDYLKAQGRRAA